MRHLILFTLILFSLISYGQKKKVKVSVIFYDNQNPGYVVTIDTLLKDREIDLTKTSIDLFFCHKNFELPYYVPTNGIFKNKAKNRECNMKIYPGNVKCYEYDELNRVIKMRVEGSGTMNNFAYKYNGKNQIMEVTDSGYDKYILTYNKDGTMSKLKESSLGLEKMLVFIYN